MGTRLATSADHIPSLPMAAARVVALLEDQNINLRDLATAIELDPGLTIRLLRFANSTFFSSTTPVSDLRRALALMGLRSAKMATLGFILSNTFPRSIKFDFDWCWQRNILNSTIARKLAAFRPTVKPEDAFLGGMIQDLGMIAWGVQHGPTYQKLIDECRSTGQSMSELEMRAFGRDHADESAQLVQRWNFAPILADGIQEHHLRRPETPLGQILAASEALTDFIQSQRQEHLFDYRGLASVVGLSTEHADEVLQKLTHTVEETKSLLSLTGSEIDPTSLIVRAQQQIVVVSMQTATEMTNTEMETLRLRQENAELVKELHRDALTELSNRRHFDEVLAETLNAHREADHPITLVLCDLDRFKRINDTYGHPVGDEVLRRVAKTIQKCIRRGDVACRYGGEEIAIIAPKLTGKLAKLMAERLRAKIESISFADQRIPYAVTASFGVATLEEGNAMTPTDLVNAADVCLYQAKTQGRNRVCATLL